MTKTILTLLLHLHSYEIPDVQTAFQSKVHVYYVTCDAYSDTLLISEVLA